MNIRPNYFNYSPNFGAHVKMRKPITDVIQNVATVGTTASTATASCAEAGFSVAETVPKMPVSVDSGVDHVTDSFAESAPEKLAEFNKKSLYSSTAEAGIPVQTTIAPTIMSGSAGSVSKFALDNIKEQCDPNKNEFADANRFSYGALGASSIASLAALGTYASSFAPADSITEQQSENACTGGSLATGMSTAIGSEKADSKNSDRKIPS